MTLLRRAGLVFGLLVAAVFVVGCGETVIDSAKMEDQLKASLSNSLGEKVVSADCPSGIKVEKGTTFDCEIKPAKGAEQVATIEIRNQNADTSVINLRPANE
jgi:NAD(P)H-hydrate repair Nnr-like enzyme with NAD(P)H-hydrate epimerase domain